MSDPSVLVRVAVRLLVAAAQPVPPSVRPCRAGHCSHGRSGLGRDRAVIARLGELLGREESDELRLFLAGGLFPVGHADAELVLRTLLRVTDRGIRRGALVVLARDLERSQGRLLTEDVDGTSLVLDPLEPITQTRLVQAAERTGKPLMRSAGTMTDLHPFSVWGTGSGVEPFGPVRVGRRTVGAVVQTGWEQKGGGS